MADPQDPKTVLLEFKFHGILMSLVVMVLMTFGMLLSRYLKPFFYRWFYVHAAVFATSLVCIIVSVILAFRANNNYFYTSAHTVLGLMFVSGMGLQSLLGLLAHFLFDPKRGAPPAFPDQLHWWLGRLLLVVGPLTVLLGLHDLGALQMSLISFYLWGITIFVVILYLESYVGQTHETAAAQDGAFTLVEDDERGNVHRKQVKHVHATHHHHTLMAPMVVYKLVGSAAVIVLVLYIVVVIGIAKVAG